MPHIDLTFQQTIHEVKLAVLFRCPECGHPITEARRLRYPMAVVHLFTPVYRCKCGKHFGAPVGVTNEDKAEQVAE